MSSGTARGESQQLWQPHPDDRAEIAEAMQAADRGELLSPQASEAFLRWMEGADDESWRADLE